MRQANKISNDLERKGTKDMALTKKAIAARRKFRAKYSKRTANVVDYHVRGWTNRDIAKKFNVKLGTVAATVANYTRGTYYPFADVIPGVTANSCRF